MWHWDHLIKFPHPSPQQKNFFNIKGQICLNFLIEVRNVFNQLNSLQSLCEVEIKWIWLILGLVSETDTWSGLVQLSRPHRSRQHHIHTRSSFYFQGRRSHRRLMLIKQYVNTHFGTGSTCICSVVSLVAQHSDSSLSLPWWRKILK